MNTSITERQSIWGNSSHAAYGDESHHNIGRYRGVGLITTTVTEASQMSKELDQIIRRNRIAELKWCELRSAKARYAAKEILDFILDKAIEYRLRVDVLSWDIEDSRHKIQGRNDIRKPTQDVLFSLQRCDVKTMAIRSNLGNIRR